MNKKYKKVHIPQVFHMHFYFIRESRGNVKQVREKFKWNDATQCQPLDVDNSVLTWCTEHSMQVSLICLCLPNHHLLPFPSICRKTRVHIDRGVNFFKTDALGLYNGAQHGLINYTWWKAIELYIIGFNVNFLLCM